MMIRRAKVLEVLSNRCHQVLFCEVIGIPDVVDEDLASRFAPGSRYKAVCYPELLGEAQVGDPSAPEARPPWLPTNHGCPMTNSPAPATW